MTPRDLIRFFLVRYASFFNSQVCSSLTFNSHVIKVEKVRQADPVWKNRRGSEASVSFLIPSFYFYPITPSGLRSRALGVIGRL